MIYRTALILAMTTLPVFMANAESQKAPDDQPAAPQKEDAEKAEKTADNAKGIIVQPKAVVRAVEEPAEDKAEDDGQNEKDTQDKATDEEPTGEELRQQMRDLERQLQQTRDEFRKQANKQREQAQEEKQKALEEIELPKNPTRKQCEAYVAELRKATEGRRSFSSGDPAVDKLKALPPEHFDLLITEMTNRSSLRYYANYAMREIEPEELRERFVNSLEDNPNNIGLIAMHGWAEDVRPIIIKHMQTADGSVSPAWFQAAVELDEPSLYPKLHEITTQSRYAGQFIAMLEMLPDYDLAHTVNVCWRRAREGKLSASYSTFAAKAASYGNVDALGTLIDQLRASSSYISSHTSYNMRRTNVLRFIDYRGSNTDIQAWFKANKDRLVFDHLRQRYVIPEDF